MKPLNFLYRTLSIAAMALAMVSIPASAHHSTSAFDNEKVIIIEGKITQVRWINPHASFKVEGTAKGGPDGLWTIEMTAPNVLINSGWRRNSITAGDKVTVFANPLHNAITLKDGSQGGLYVGIILGDGSTLGQTDGKGEGTNR